MKAFLAVGSVITRTANVADTTVWTLWALQTLRAVFSLQTRCSVGACKTVRPRSPNRARVATFALAASNARVAVNAVSTWSAISA